MLEKAHEMDLKAVIATNFSEVFDLTINMTRSPSHSM
jgi:hypothetical protein